MLKVATRTSTSDARASDTRARLQRALGDAWEVRWLVGRGGFAEQTILTADNAYAVPDAMSDAAAAVGSVKRTIITPVRVGLG